MLIRKALDPARKIRGANGITHLGLYGYRTPPVYGGLGENGASGGAGPRR